MSSAKTPHIHKIAGLKRSAERLLGINHGEWGILSLFFLLYFLNGFGACIGLNAGDSLFIEGYGVENIPVIFLCTSVFTVLVTLFLSYLANRFRITAYARAVFAVLFVLLGLTYICLVTRPGQVLFTAVLFVFAYSFFIITKTLLFDLSGVFFDLRQSKRLFPLFSSGTVLGLASAGLLTGQLLALVHRSIHLVPVWGVCLALAGVTMAFMIRRMNVSIVAETDSPARKKPVHPLHDLMEGIVFQLRSLKRSRLLLCIAVVSFATAFVVVHFDFIYMSAVKERFGDPEKVTQVFGKVRGYSTLIAFSLQFMLSTLLIRVMGITQVLFIFPLFFTFIYGMIFCRISFAAVLIGRFGYYITKEAFHFPALTPLFNALSGKVRKYANALINNIVAQSGIVAGGLFLAIFVKSGILSVQGSIPAALVLLLLMLGMMILIRKEYVRELLSNIKEQSPRQLDMLEAVKVLKGTGALASMREILRGEDRELILFVIESLKRMDSAQADPEIIALLVQHDDPVIARKVLEYFHGTFKSGIISVMDDVLAFDNEQTKLLLLDYMASFFPDPKDRGSDRVEPYIRRLFDDTHACVRMKAASVLSCADSAEDREQAREYMAAELRNASADDVLALIQTVLADTSDFIIDQILAQKGKFPVHTRAEHDLIPRYLDILARFPVSRVLSHVLTMVHEDESLLGVIRTRFTSIHSEEECRQYADAILELRSGDMDPGRLTTLTKMLLYLRRLPAEEEAFLLEMLFSSPRTGRLHFQIAAKTPYFLTQPDETMDRRLSTWVLREIEGMQACLFAQREFRDEDTQYSHIFEDETARLMQARKDAVLNVIQYQYADQQMDIAVSGLRSSSPGLHASAVETIENILPRKTAELLIPFIEGNLDKAYEQSREQQDALDLEGILGEWIDSDIAWLSCLAMYLAAECRLTGLKGMIEKKRTGSPLAGELRESFLQTVG